MTVCAKEREGGSGNGDKPAAVRVTITPAVMIETRTPMPMARNHERQSRSCALVAHSVPAGPQPGQQPTSDVPARQGDRKRACTGKSRSVSVNHGAQRVIKKKHKKKHN